MDKDKSIITQVAAKIASELTVANANIGAFADNFEAVTELLMKAIYKGATPSDEAILTAAFPEATLVSGLRVKNDQQGPLPQWLIDACAKDGVTEVYDNRADLKDNPKRPWFKAVNDKDKAYWPPRGN